MIQIHGDGVPMIKRIKAPSLLDDMDQPVLIPVDLFELIVKILSQIDKFYGTHVLKHKLD